MPVMETDLSHSLISVRGGKANIPEAFHHISHFPVLSSKRIKYFQEEEEEDNDHKHLTALRLALFVDTHYGVAKHIASYLTAREKLAFLQTHKTQIDHKQILGMFSTPSMDDKYLWTQVKNVKHQGMPMYYRGLELCRAVPTSHVAHTVLRVLEGWMSSPADKVETVTATVSKVKQVFHPSREVWHQLLNGFDANGMTLLTYAVWVGVSPATLSTLLQIAPCLDAGLADKCHQRSPMQLATALERPKEVLDILSKHT